MNSLTNSIIPLAGIQHEYCEDYLKGKSKTSKKEISNQFFEDYQI